MNSCNAAMSSADQAGWSVAYPGQHVVVLLRTTHHDHALHGRSSPLAPRRCLSPETSGPPTHPGHPPTTESRIGSPLTAVRRGTLADPPPIIRSRPAPARSRVPPWPGRSAMGAPSHSAPRSSGCTASARNITAPERDQAGPVPRSRDAEAGRGSRRRSSSARLSTAVSRRGGASRARVTGRCGRSARGRPSAISPRAAASRRIRSSAESLGVTTWSTKASRSSGVRYSSVTDRSPLRPSPWHASSAPPRTCRGGLERSTDLRMIERESRSVGRFPARGRGEPADAEPRRRTR